MICLVCRKEVLETDLKFFLYLDIPRVTLVLHRNCFKDVKHKINDVLQENKEFIYEVFDGRIQEKKHKTTKAI